MYMDAVAEICFLKVLITNVDPAMPFKKVYQTYMESMGFKDESAIIGDSEQTKTVGEAKYWMKDSISIKWLESIITAVERGPRGVRKPKIPKSENSENLTPRSDLSLPHFLPASHSRTASLLAKDTAMSGSVDDDSMVGPIGNDSGSEDTDALIARVNQKIKKRTKVLKYKTDLSHMPQIPLYPDDEVMIAAEIEKLRQLYPNPHLPPAPKRPTEDQYENSTKKQKIDA